MLILFLISVIRAQTEVFSFGSCNQFFYTHSLDVYRQIAREKPSHFIFLGDMVYLDTYVFPGPPMVWRAEKNMTEVTRRFAKFLQQKEIRDLIAGGTKLQYVWDDHDYNMNNGGVDNPLKADLLKTLLSVLGLKTAFQNAMNQRVKLSEKVQLILLDIRSFRKEVSIFQEDTWTWLENVLMDTPNDHLTLIGSGIQIIYDERPVTEKWDIASRKRLFQLLYRLRSHAILLSGDVHFGQIGYRGIYQVTSSGLTFSAADHIPFAQQLLSFLPEYYNKKQDRYVGKNYGLIKVHYESGKIGIIELAVKKHTGDVALSKNITFDETQIKQLDLVDLSVDHMDQFYKSVLKNILENPLRMAYLVPMQVPLILIVITMVQLFRCHID